MSVTANKALVRHFFESLATKNPAVIDELVSADIVMHAGAATTESSREEIKQRTAAAFKFVQDITLTIEDMLAEGDKVAVRYSFSLAVTSPPTKGARPTEAADRATGTGMLILRLVDGQITESWSEGGSTTHRFAFSGPRPAPQR